MASQPAQTEAHRHERKFLIRDPARTAAELGIRLNPGMFSNLYHPRTVNNIYLDSPALAFYFMNLAGNGERTKVRVRWYGSLFGPIARPVMEFKVKQGLAGQKESFPLQPFVLDETFNVAAFQRVLRESQLPPRAQQVLAGLEPAIINRYHRRYFQSADRHYRLTLDSDLEFFRVRPAHNAFLGRVADHSVQVLELKYDVAHEQGADAIAHAFPFRLTKMSKYVFGLDCLDGF